MPGNAPVESCGCPVMVVQESAGARSASDSTEPGAVVARDREGRMITWRLWPSARCVAAGADAEVADAGIDRPTDAPDEAGLDAEMGE
jgi:hypothetical protein